MAYKLITNIDSKNFTPNHQVSAVFGRPRTIESITIHWWGLPEWGDTFEGVCNFLATNNKPTSAHEVIEAGRVAVLVNHLDASWAAGNPDGNATSIHLECRPRAATEDYQTVAERIRDLRAHYGDLPLIPHNHWQATQCPGHWDLAKLDRLARSLKDSAPAKGPAANPLPSNPKEITLASVREILHQQVPLNPTDKAFIKGLRLSVEYLLYYAYRNSTLILTEVKAIRKLLEAKK